MFTLFGKIVRTISLNKVFIWSLTLLLVITGYTVYENQGRIFAALDAPAGPGHKVSQTFKISDSTKKSLNDAVIADNSIIGIAVMSTDLRVNEAQTVYFFGDQKLLSDTVEASNTAGTNRLPLFTADEANNNEVIKLINGQYSCVKFETTLISKIYPELFPTVKGLCRSGIPSYYGYFSGFVGIFLTDYPSVDRQLQLKILADRLANEIYFHDVLPSQHSGVTP